ncbi:MAG: hypothetical protein AAGM22_31545, partial [Acidobacteriota bacterium]
APEAYGVDGAYPNALGHYRLAGVCESGLAEPWGLRPPGPGRDLSPPAPPKDLPNPVGRGLGITVGAAAATGEAAVGRTPPPGRRELTLQLDADSSFCCLALVDAADPAADPGAKGRTAGRPSLDEVLSGPLLGLASLCGVVDVAVEDPAADGGRGLELGLPVPLRTELTSSLRSAELVETPLNDLSVSSSGSFIGRADADGQADAAGSLSVRTAFLGALTALNPELPTPDVELRVAVSPQIDGSSTEFFVDLRLRACWTFESEFVLPLPGAPAGAWRGLETEPAQLLLFLRLTTRPELTADVPLEPQRRPTRDSLSGTARQADLPTLAVLEADYDLHAEALGGGARDERRLLGLTRVDLGESVGHLQPVLFSLESPTVLRGGRRLLGFDGEVRFPRRLWRRRLPSWQHLVPTLGVVERHSGAFLGGLRLAAHSNGLPEAVECRIDATGRLSEDDGQLWLDLEGGARVELGEGTPFTFSGAAGALDGPSTVTFRLRLEATGAMAAPGGVLSGEERLVSRSRQLFSFRYVLPPRPNEKTVFEYTNHSTGGRFQLTCPLRLLFARSPGAGSKREPDTVILEGLGAWSDGGAAPSSTLRHLIFVCRTSKAAPYVAVLIDGGVLSNVDAGQA